MDAKKTMTLSAEKHEAEEHLSGLFKEAAPEAEGPIAAARAAGIPWKTIFQLLLQFGPGFVAALQAIIAGINSTPPSKEEHEAAEKAHKERGKAKTEKAEKAEKDESEPEEEPKKAHATHAHHASHATHSHAKDK